MERVASFTAAEILIILEATHTPAECGPDCPCQKIREYLSSEERLVEILNAAKETEGFSQETQNTKSVSLEDFGEQYPNQQS